MKRKPHARVTYEWTPELEGVKPYIRYFVDERGTNWEIWIYDKGFFEFAEKYDQIILTNIWVHEKYRGRGYGTKLFEKALLWATLLGKDLAVTPADEKFWNKIMRMYPNKPTRDARVAFFLLNPRIVEERPGYAKIEVEK